MTEKRAIAITVKPEQGARYQGSSILIDRKPSIRRMIFGHVGEAELLRIRQELRIHHLLPNEVTFSVVNTRDGQATKTRRVIHFHHLNHRVEDLEKRIDKMKVSPEQSELEAAIKRNAKTSLREENKHDSILIASGAARHPGPANKIRRFFIKLGIYHNHSIQDTVVNRLLDQPESHEYDIRHALDRIHERFLRPQETPDQPPFLEQAIDVSSNFIGFVWPKGATILDDLVAAQEAVGSRTTLAGKIFQVVAAGVSDYAEKVVEHVSKNDKYVELKKAAFAQKNIFTKIKGRLIYGTMTGFNKNKARLASWALGIIFNPIPTKQAVHKLDNQRDMILLNGLTDFFHQDQINKDPGALRKDLASKVYQLIMGNDAINKKIRASQVFGPQKRRDFSINNNYLLGAIVNKLDEFQAHMGPSEPIGNKQQWIVAHEYAQKLAEVAEAAEAVLFNARDRESLK